MPQMLRVFAVVLVVLVALTTPAGAAGERDVTIAQGIDAEFLDVQMTNNIVTLIINTSIYDTLLTRDKQLNLVPSLATAYKNVSEKVCSKRFSIALWARFIDPPIGCATR